jgi:hypothetical protein
VLEVLRNQREADGAATVKFPASLYERNLRSQTSSHAIVMDCSSEDISH